MVAAGELGGTTSPSRDPVDLVLRQLSEPLPSRIEVRLVPVRVGIGVVEGLATHRTEAGAVRAAEVLGGRCKRKRIACPGVEVEDIVLDVGASQLLVDRATLIDLAGVDRQLQNGVLEAARARSADRDVELQANRPTRGRARDLEAGARRLVSHGVPDSAQLDCGELDPGFHSTAPTRGQAQSSEVDALRFHPQATLRVPPQNPQAGRRPASRLYHGRPACRGSAVRPTQGSVSAQFHFDPDGYLEMIRGEVPRFDELQDCAIAAIPFAPGRVLELGIGTGETTRRLLERYPDAEVTGLDASPEMVFRARELGIGVRLARMQDPLPDGPWDLVISVLSVHHLDADGKRDLFRRVREQSRSLVIADVVKADVSVAPIEPGFDFPDRATDLAEWAGGEVIWQAEDLAVLVARYE